MIHDIVRGRVRLNRVCVKSSSHYCVMSRRRIVSAQTSVCTMVRATDTLRHMKPSRTLAGFGAELGKYLILAIGVLQGGKI